MNRIYLQSTHFIDKPTDSIWEVISQGDHVEAWHPLVQHSIVSQNHRVCRTEQGKLEETILVNDVIHKTFKYLIHPQKVYPVHSEIISTMKLVERGSGTVFLWDIEYDAMNKKKKNDMEEGFTILSDSVARKLMEIC